MENNPNIAKEWWAKRRLKYNVGLVIAGFVAFCFYVAFGVTLIMPRDPQFEITLFTTFFQGMGYLVMIAFANIFYSLGYLADIIFNSNNNDKFRRRLFNFGYWFSVGLPFLIPVGLLIEWIFNLNYLFKI